MKHGSVKKNNYKQEDDYQASSSCESFGRAKDDQSAQHPWDKPYLKHDNPGKNAIFRLQLSKR